MIHAQIELIQLFWVNYSLTNPHSACLTVHWWNGQQVCVFSIRLAIPDLIFMKTLFGSTIDNSLTFYLCQGLIRRGRTLWLSHSQLQHACGSRLSEEIFHMILQPPRPTVIPSPCHTFGLIWQQATPQKQTLLI